MGLNELFDEAQRNRQARVDAATRKEEQDKKAEFAAKTKKIRDDLKLHLPRLSANVDFNPNVDSTGNGYATFVVEKHALRIVSQGRPPQTQFVITEEPPQAKTTGAVSTFYDPSKVDPIVEDDLLISLKEFLQRLH